MRADAVAVHIDGAVAVNAVETELKAAAGPIGGDVELVPIGGGGIGGDGETLHDPFAGDGDIGPRFRFVGDELFKAGGRIGAEFPGTVKGKQRRSHAGFRHGTRREFRQGDVGKGIRDRVRPSGQREGGSQRAEPEEFCGGTGHDFNWKGWIKTGQP